jgi:predicted phosphohydrolase
MRIIHISDTHSKHHQLSDLPDADMIIHSGDLSWTGTGLEIVDFVDWFGSLDYQYKIFIAGNHDFCMDRKKPETIQRFLPANCFYLYNSGISIEGLKFWGIPLFISDEIGSFPPLIMAQIPADTDILVTHQPPYGILDRAKGTTYGCPHLLDAVLKISPRYHLFGHIHDAYGVDKLPETTFANSAVLNEDYHLSNKPFVFEI